MKVLVAYASKHGSTHAIAEVIAEELHTHSVDAGLHDVNEITDIQGYDAVILGSALYAGSWLPEAKRFAEQHQAELSKRPLWVFSSGPLGKGPALPPVDTKKIGTSLGDTPVRDHHVFVGKLDPEDLGFVERMMVKVVKAPYGDFRDWDEVRGWARAVARELAPETAPASW